MVTKILNGQKVETNTENTQTHVMSDKLHTLSNITFGDESNLEVNEIGGKAYNLIKLKQEGFNVPKFFVIKTNVFKEFISTNNTSAFVSNSNTAINKSTVKMRLPNRLNDEILYAYKSTFGSEKVAVRSSATIEDMEKESMAGRFRTVLFVDGTTLLDAVNEVYSSLGSTYVSEHEKPLMAIVIQRQINSQTAGVAFVDREKTIISAVIGQGEQLVSGRENGDVYIYKENDYKAIIKAQNYAILNSGLTKGLPPIIRTRQKLPGFKIKEISEISKKIIDVFKGPQDIEWCIANNELFVLQSRPITKKLEVEKNLGVGGLIPVTSGIARGVPCFDVANIPEHDVILIVPYIEIQDMENVIANKNVKGIITEFGGMLSHESIIAREKGIPYLAGFRSQKRAIESSKEIILDTTKPSLLVDGREIVAKDVESYNWLNRDLDGLETIQLDDEYISGIVIRRVGTFVIAYGEIKDDKQLEKLRKKLYKNGNNINNDILIDTQDRRLPFLHKAVINSINMDESISQYVVPLVEAVQTFDVKKFRIYYKKAVDLLKIRFVELSMLYSEHKKIENKQSLESLLKSLAKINGLYKGVRIMPEYFEYVLGSFISEREGHIVTDIEMYKLVEKYKNEFPQLVRMNEVLEDTIENIDSAIPLVGKTNSLDAIFEAGVLDAQKLLSEERMFALLLGISNEV
jgi:phosphohistidine swiveling domain-containing protein